MAVVQGRPAGHRGDDPGRRATPSRAINDAIAEPVVYMIDRYVVGGFYRVNTERGTDENLNAPGMHFEPLAFETPAPARLRRRAGRPAQPLLRLRRGRAAGAAGGGDRARGARRGPEPVAAADRPAERPSVRPRRATRSRPRSRGRRSRSRGRATDDGTNLAPRTARPGQDRRDRPRGRSCTARTPCTSAARPSARATTPATRWARSPAWWSSPTASTPASTSRSTPSCTTPNWSRRAAWSQELLRRRRRRADRAGHGPAGTRPAADRPARLDPVRHPHAGEGALPRRRRLFADRAGARADAGGDRRRARARAGRHRARALRPRRAVRGLLRPVLHQPRADRAQRQPRRLLAGLPPALHPAGRAGPRRRLRQAPAVAEGQQPERQPARA